MSALTVSSVQRAALRLVTQRKAGPVLARPSPRDWAREHAVLRTADGRVLRYAEVAREYQDAILADTSSRVIIAKSRQIGISQTVAFIAADEAVHAGTVLWISRSGDQASMALDYVYTALSQVDHPAYVTQNQQSFQLANGGQVISQPATRSAGRGIAASLVIVDEQAWQLYAREIYTAVVPTLATTGGRLIVLSTPNGRDNLFFELWSTAQEPVHGWSPHFLPWWVHPDWDEAWAEARRDDMGPQAFAQEHDVDFIVSGLAVFDPEQVERLFRLAAYPPADPRHRYLSAFDIARRRDAFVRFTIDVSTSPFQLAGYERHLNLPYPVQADIIARTKATYPGIVIVESNGPGDPLIEFVTVPVEPFTTGPLNKRNAITALQLLLQRGELVAPTVEAAPELAQFKRELLAYQWQDEKLVQDTVMAGAIAALKAGRPVRKMEAFF